MAKKIGESKEMIKQDKENEVAAALLCLSLWWLQ
jgi:hypothetical protein